MPCSLSVWVSSHLPYFWCSFTASLNVVWLVAHNVLKAAASRADTIRVLCDDTHMFFLHEGRGYRRTSRWRSGTTRCLTFMQLWAYWEKNVVSCLACPPYRLQHRIVLLWQRQEVGSQGAYKQQHSRPVRYPWVASCQP